ncbi:hypothetical protein ABDD95_13285 [Mucilaginibacter sp. PAMB04274]|uniref:hypothetical protein n=1 Tax=Mucilaginibacter sp. PAMB04274 TaxID=3138568 RepID=UPI0031F6DA68
MNSKVKEFIESGILEAYVTGSASSVEERDVLYMKAHYAEVNEELQKLEEDLEKIADGMAIPPPPGLWDQIEAEIDSLERIPNKPALKIDHDGSGYKKETGSRQNNFIEVEAESTHMRVHKAWRWVFAAVFVLGKIFLAAAIYYYLENRQAQQNIQDLKQQLKEVRGK